MAQWGKTDGNSEAKYKRAGWDGQGTGQGQRNGGIGLDREPVGRGVHESDCPWAGLDLDETGRGLACPW